MNRVLHLLGPSTGGIRAHVAALAAALDERGWRVATAGPDGVLGQLAVLDHVVPVPDGLAPAQLVGATRAISRLAGSFDLVHAHGLKAGWIAAAARTGVPLVVSVHNLVLDEVAGLRARPLRVIEGALIGRAAGTIAISDEVARRFTGLPGAGRIRTVAPLGPAPVPTRDAEQVRTALGIPAKAPLVVTAARLNPQKGLDDLLTAARLLAEAVPDVRWVVLGEGALRGHLEAEVLRLGLGGVVLLAGGRPSVADELAAADVVAVTSRWESGPLVVLEALALGRPVVSTSVGLVPDVIGPGDGRVVPVGDPAAMAAGIVDVLSTPRRALVVGPGQDRYGPDRLVPPIEAVYREVLGR